MQIETIEGRFLSTPDGKAAVADHGMVATAFPAATQAGVDMLRQGGNAVDAACAAAVALGVCEPQGSGIGGQSMAILHLGGKTITLDGSSRVPALAASIRETIDPSLPRLDSRQSGGETTHLSVMDVEGNAVGITQSIELVYGSKAAADGLGFLYNNYMDSLDLHNPAHPFYLRPNASPWTSVAPALVFHNDALWMVTGSPGSERIYSAISQFLIHMIDADLSMAEAVEQPRLRCSIGGKLSIEADRFAPDIPGYLGDMGYWLDPREPYAFYLGAIHAVLKCQTQTGFQGAAEVRRDGTADGL